MRGGHNVPRIFLEPDADGSDRGAFAPANGLRQADIARDFVGVAGCWYPRGNGRIHHPIMPLSPGVPVHAAGLWDMQDACCLQLMRPGLFLSAPGPFSSHDDCVALCGSIWDAPREVGESGYDAFCRLLLEAARRGDFRSLRNIDGDFVACVLQRDRVYLLRALTSTGGLFYTQTGDALRWSVNFMDLVRDPFGELDRRAVAYVAYGCNRIPYPRIAFLAAGTVVCFDGRRVTTECFDEYEEPLPVKLTLAEWGYGIRERLETAVAKRVRPFRKVGLLLSGGIDSSSLAACLSKAGVDTECYHWSAPDLPAADESDHARRVAERCGLPLRLLDIGQYARAGSGYIDSSWRFSVPNNHMLYRAWHDTARLAEGTVDCLITGRFADGLLNDSTPHFTLSPFHLWRRMGFILGTAFLWNALGVSLTQMRLRRGIVPKRLLSNLPSDRIVYSTEATPRFLSPWRQMTHFHADAQAAVVELLGDDDCGLLQTLALDVEELWPRGVLHVTPYLDRELGTFVRGLPTEYLRLPLGGELIQKPALKRAFVDELPPESIRRNSGVNVDTIVQSFWMNNRNLVKELFSPESCLARLGILCPERCVSLTEDPRLLQSSAATLSVNAMVELWLRSIAKEEATC